MFIGTNDTLFLWTPRIYFTVTLSITQSRQYIRYNGCLDPWGVSTILLVLPLQGQNTLGCHRKITQCEIASLLSTVYNGNLVWIKKEKGQVKVKVIEIKKAVTILHLLINYNWPTNDQHKTTTHDSFKCIATDQTISSHTKTLPFFHIYSIL